MVDSSEDIVISGIGGYFPDCKNIGEWKEKLFDNETIQLKEKWPKDSGICNLIGEITSDRFDNSFFGIHKSQADFMSPFHRLCCERTFEAVIDAGINPDSLRGRKIGCYFGLSVDEMECGFLNIVSSGYGVTGKSRAMFSNRISYWLDLKGPSVTYDCNWITGLEVIRLACEAIKREECEAAIVGAANLIFYPEFHNNYDELELISPNGKTKAFDANANGYGRSEGMVILYIQKASEANRSYGNIIHVDTRYDGVMDDKPMELSSSHMIDFLEKFFSNSPIKPELIDYVETYGCGIKKIDKMEVDSLEAVYCKNRSNPLLIGSVKNHSGHSECCSTLFSLVKVLLAFEEEIIPATLQIEKLNSEIRGLQNGNLEVVQTNREWNSDYAAINGIGINQYYGHMIVKRNNKKKNIVKTNIPTILPVSARTEETVQKILTAVQEKPDDPEYNRLVQEVFYKQIPQHMYRGYIVKGVNIKQEYRNVESRNQSVWFVYSGMGSQWCGMLTDFMKFPVFAKSITNSQNILMTRGVDLMNILTSKDQAVFENIMHCFVGIAAMQIALTDLLNAIGIVPDGIIGHSVGELGCAYADGCMTAEEMILAAYYRGKASLEATLIEGMMAAIGIGNDQIKDKLPPTIDVACHNNSENCTISGPTRDMKVYVNELRDRGIFARLVNVANIAYHSRYIKPAAPILNQYLKAVLPTPTPRSSKWISTSNKAETWDTDLAKYSSAEYHTNNLLSTVLFQEGCEHIPNDAILIEIAPHGLLQAILKRSMKKCSIIPLTNKASNSGAEFFLHSLGMLYLLEKDLNFFELYPPVNFPVSRNTPTLSNLASWHHNDMWADDYVERNKVLKNLRINLNSKIFVDLLGHQIKENAVLPVGMYLSFVYQNLESDYEEVVFENLNFKKQLVLSKTTETTLHLILQSYSGGFEIYANKELLMTGTVKFDEESKSLQHTEKTDLNENYTELQEIDFYKELKHRGYSYTGSYKIVKSIFLTNEGSVARIDSGIQWPILIDGMIQQHILTSGEKFQNILLPQRIYKIRVNTKIFIENDKIFEVNYKDVTKTFYTDGVQITDMEMAPWSMEESEFALESVEYVLLDKISFKESEAALEFAIQLTRSNFKTEGITTILVNDLISTSSLFLEALKNISKALLHLKVEITSVTSVEEIYLQQTYPQLVVVEDNPNEDLLKKMLTFDVFLFAKSSEYVMTYPGLTELVRLSVNTQEFSIFRRKNTTENVIVNIGDTRLNLEVFGSSKPSWFRNLIEKAKSLENTTKLFMVSSSIPVEGFDYFVRKMRNQPHMQNVRFLFNFDQTECNIKRAVEKDLIFTILKNGKLYTKINQFLKYKEEKVSSVSSEIADRKKLIQYFSLNLSDETADQSNCNNYVGNIDYSGFDKNGQRVMGLAQIDDSSQNQIDPIFVWEVPENWSLPDAATATHAYLSAYYMMVVKAEIHKCDIVLIHAATSPVGLAAISVAYANNCLIFATVFNAHQKTYLLKRYYFLNKHNVFVIGDRPFKMEFMEATRGQGAKLVLNCLSGEYLRDSFDCCGIIGNFIHYGKYDLDNGNSIGMSKFMKNISLYVVDLNQMVTLKNELKHRLWKLFADGLKVNDVRPLTWKYGSPKDISNIIGDMRNGSSIEKIVLSTSELPTNNIASIVTSSKFICCAESSYVVIGGNSETWMNVVEWLVHIGAKKIIISTDLKISQNNLNRRLTLLKKYFKAHIDVKKVNVTTKMGITELLRESSMHGPIGAVFIVPKDLDTIQPDEQALTEILIGVMKKIIPATLLINYIHTAAGICYAVDDEFKSYTIELMKGGDIRQGLKALNYVIPIFSSHTIMSRKMEQRQSIIGIGKILPQLIDIIETQKLSTSEPNIVQILTQGPSNIRELAPIFIIQGVAGRTEVEKMVKTLLYPTYCTVMPCEPWSIEKLAEIYAQKIVEIHPKNVYNLVSVSTGGPLMLEIAKKLQDLRGEVALHLFFINNTPLIIQDAIAQLGETTDYEINILRAIFDICDVKVLKDLQSLEDWGKRVRYCTKFCNSQDENFLQRGLISLKHLLDISKHYIVQSSSIIGEVHVLKPSKDKLTDCNFKKFCEQPPLVKHIEGDHLSLICHPDTIDYINYHVEV